ncbi:MAG: polyprenyl synthetase family protein, partial [Bradymonadaceae bacterium]
EKEFQLKRTETPSAAAYFRMVEGKTGGLLRLTLAGAAEVCGAPDPVVEALEVAGADLGVLFQIQDDILDLYGEKGRDHRGTDVAEGKISALVVHYLEHAPNARGNWLRDLLRADREATSLEEIEEVAGAFRRQGSLAAALAEIDRRRQRVATMSALDDYPTLTELLDGLAAWFVSPIDHVSADTDEATPLSQHPKGDP